MDSPPSTTTADNGAAAEAYASMVDPFLVEAVQNPRQRLTILRMELDVQKFLKNPDQQQFEFQHFPTSYLRLAAHRVAQHYGLQTMVQDNAFDGPGSIIVVKKLAESRYPAIRLSEIPAKQLANDRHEPIQIVMRPRPDRIFPNEAREAGIKQNSARTMEERKEEYDRARARIFSRKPSCPESEDLVLQDALGMKNTCLSVDKTEGCKNSMTHSEKNPSIRDEGTSSRVAVFRDREKDLTDPDYDRSYERYVKNMQNNQSSSLAPFNMHNFQSPGQYCAAFPQLGRVPRTQASVSYMTPIMSPFCDMGLNTTSGDALYMQWPTSAMMYAQSYDQFTHAVFQAPYCQQPLSFDYSQNR